MLFEYLLRLSYLICSILVVKVGIFSRQAIIGNSTTSGKVAEDHNATITTANHLEMMTQALNGAIRGKSHILQQTRIKI